MSCNTVVRGSGSLGNAGFLVALCGDRRRAEGLFRYLVGFRLRGDVRAWEVAPYVKISSPKHAPCSVKQAEMLPFLFLWIAF
jgi:hypothetical protein